MAPEPARLAGWATSARSAKVLASLDVQSSAAWSAKLATGFQRRPPNSRWVLDHRWSSMDPQVASFGAGCLQNAAAAGELECLGCLGHPAFRREQYGTINRKVLPLFFSMAVSAPWPWPRWESTAAPSHSWSPWLRVPCPSASKRKSSWAFDKSWRLLGDTSNFSGFRCYKIWCSFGKNCSVQCEHMLITTSDISKSTTHCCFKALYGISDDNQFVCHRLWPFPAAMSPKTCCLPEGAAAAACGIGCGEKCSRLWYTLSEGTFNVLRNLLSFGEKESLHCPTA